MQSSQLIPILLNLLAAIFGALGQWLYKIGGVQMKTTPLLKNWPLFVGMFLFCIVMVLFVWAFRMGGKLSVTYPVYATTFVWGMLIATYFDKEPWAWLQVFGIALIVIGVSFVAGFSPK